MSERRIYIDELIEIIGEPPAELLYPIRWWKFVDVSLKCHIHSDMSVKHIRWFGKEGSRLLSFQQAFEICPKYLQERLIFHLDIFTDEKYEPNV